MPPKQKTPAPIDRPLSRAYLRQFTGWAPEHPPGISDPTSLRIMANTQVQRDGSLRVRPGLRYLSINNGEELGPIEHAPVGTHEPFFLNNNSKAYLFAVRETDGSVGFRVLGNPDGTGLRVRLITDPGIEFAIPRGYDALKFTAATSYVKYLQIDNKIFALSNAGEPMRQFEVGESKIAKTLTGIQRPNFDVPDKLVVVHPETPWVSSGVPVGERWNKLLNPSFETSMYAWTAGNSRCSAIRSTTQAMSGGVASARVETVPARTNYMPYPLRGPVASIAGWGAGSGTPAVATIVSGWMQWDVPPIDTNCYYNSPITYGIVPGRNYQFSMDWERSFTQVYIGGIYRWFASNGAQIGGDIPFDVPFDPDPWVDPTMASGRSYITTGAAPSGAASVVFYPYGYLSSATGIGGGTIGYLRIRNVMVEEIGPGGYDWTDYFDGSEGADYSWTGAANASSSIYAPDNAYLALNYTQAIPVIAGYTYVASIYMKAGTTPRSFKLQMRYYSPGFGAMLGLFEQTVADVNTSFTRIHKIAVAPAGATILMVNVVSTTSAPLGEYHYFDQAIVENSATLKPYFDGSVTDTSLLIYDWNGAAHTTESREREWSAPVAVPTAATPTADTLISSDPLKNTYSAGFFYTFSNEIGESAASQVTVVKMQRGWSQWKWELGTAGAPNGTATLDPGLCADQLVAYMPGTTFQDALDQGATKWSLYMLTWSNQDPAPVQAVRLSVRDLPAGTAHGARGWQRMTPQQADANAEVVGLPSEVNRYNYSNPSKGGQGIIAADRMVMVFDPVDPAVIRWSSGQMGNYTDFSAHRGGGYKTLTSGNLNVAGCVKLWQNPQSTDTLTILCLGTDGYSTGYYMAPAQIASQSEATNIMGFEETTATPGTVSPYGCEVMNNALYHPLDEMVMKSTATNYNINHSSITDSIQTVWRGLMHKEQIVSSLHDTRIYYLVNNPRGEVLEPGCWGNEVWVFDGQAKAGSWSRWLVQGQSLRKFEQGDEIVMSIIRPDGIYYFDEYHSHDDYVPAPGILGSRHIPWRIETNTQGANRAHDAWAYLQQVGIVVGNFQGQMRYGVRGLDLNGKKVDVSKVVKDTNSPGTDHLPFDLEDFLQVKRTMKEWFFYAESVIDEEGALQHSEGQINLVQYRYAPSTVNTGAEFGSIETFEYGVDSTVNASNGIPLPYIDTRRP